MSTSPLSTSAPPRLLDQLRLRALDHFGRPEPGERYACWATRYIRFHGKRHPHELRAGDVGRFLEHVARTEKDPVTALEPAHEALTFLYRELLRVDLGTVPLPTPPRLLDRVRHAIRLRHYSPRREEC